MNLRQRITTLERRCEREARQREDTVPVRCGSWTMGADGGIVPDSGPVLPLNCEEGYGVMAVRPVLTVEDFPAAVARMVAYQEKLHKAAKERFGVQVESVAGSPENHKSVSEQVLAKIGSSDTNSCAPEEPQKRDHSLLLRG